MKKIFITLVFSTSALAQSAYYSDVLVVINSNSSISDSIGTYFAQQRKIADEHIVRVDVPVNEEIDSLTFETFRKQIENFLISNNLKDSINYIVTTKGLPLKVKRIAVNASSSVESELTLILGPYSSYIGCAGSVVSPYRLKTEDFSHAKFGIYLVTRLDGYSFADVKGLIDRSNRISNVIPANGIFSFDADPSWAIAAGNLNVNMTNAVSSLQQRGLQTQYNQDTIYLTHQTNLLGYVSWGSNDRNAKNFTSNAKSFNTYMNGAIAETYVSTSARSFSTPPVYGQSLIADLIADGVTGVKGYAYEPYSSAMANVQILYSMYADGFNLAECYYSSSNFLSWMDVVIGDPKFCLISTRVGDVYKDNASQIVTALPVELVSFTAAQKDQSVQLQWSTATEINNAGFEIQSFKENNSAWISIGFIEGSGTSNASHQYSFIDRSAVDGKNRYRLIQKDNDGKQKNLKEIEIIYQRRNTMQTVVLHNYPNPFNPQTTITIDIPKDDKVAVMIYDALGRYIGKVYEEFTRAGEIKVAFDATRLASGMYYAVAKTTQSLAVCKMSLVR